MPPIPLDSHPLILERIVANAPHVSLLALRAVSREMRDAIDKFILTHVAVYHSARKVMAKLPEGHRRIPCSDWLNVPKLTDAVRIIDIIVTEEDEQAARAYNLERAEAVLLHQQYPHSRHPPPIGTPRCWCNRDTVDVCSFNFYLSLRLQRVALIRQWRGHRCRQRIKTQRMVTFLPSVVVNPAQAFLNGDAETSSCHVVHIGYADAPVFEHHTFPQNVGHIIVRIAPPANRPSARRDGDLPVYLASIAMRMDTRPYNSLVNVLARQVANHVTVTLVGFERWPLYPCHAMLFPNKRDFRASLQRSQRIPEKDARHLADCKVKLLTEEDYRQQVGWLYELEAYCEQIGA